MKKLSIEKFSFISMAFGIVILSAFFLGLPFSLSAETIIRDSQYEKQNNNVQQMIVQTFTPDDDAYYSGIKIFGGSGGQSCSDAVIKFCFGDYIDNDAATSTDCGANITIATVSLGGAQSSATSTYEFDESVEFLSGGEYYVKLYCDNYGSSVRSAASDDADSYLNGKHYKWGNYYNEEIDSDLTFELYFDTSVPIDTDDYDDVEIVDIPAWDGIVQVGSAFLDYIDPKTCIIGYTCRLQFGYTFDDNNHHFYLTRNLSGLWYDLDNAVDHVQVDTSSTTLLIDWFDIPATSTKTTEEFCIIELDEDYDPQNLYCEPLETGEGTIGPTINWVYPGTTRIDDFFDFDCDCSDVATSTSEGFLEEWADAFNWGFQCGLRKLSCWAFSPSENSVLRFTESYYSITHDFPFDIVNQFDEEMRSIASSTISATTSEAFTINITDLTGIDGYDNDLVFANSSMMSDTFGELWTKIYSLMEYVVYMFGAFFIFSRLFSLGGNKDFANFKDEVGAYREDRKRRKINVIDLRKK